MVVPAALMFNVPSPDCTIVPLVFNNTPCELVALASMFIVPAVVWTMLVLDVVLRKSAPAFSALAVILKLPVPD